VSLHPLAVLAFIGVAFTTPALAQTYRLVDLGTLGGAHSCANAINAKGDAVGVSTLRAGDVGGHAVLWSGGKIVDLGTFDDLTYSEAHGISDNGQVVGEGYAPANPDVKRRALGFGAAKPALLGMVSSAKPNADTYDVNDAGLAVGRALLGDPSTTHGARAIVIERGAARVLDAYTLPGDLGRFTPETAAAVNAKGVVVGWARGAIAGKSLRRAFRWVNGKADDPLLAFDRTNDTYACDVNAAGDIACGMRLRFDAENPDLPGIGTEQALIVCGDKVTLVGVPDGYENTELHALNARGDAVGRAWGPTGEQPILVLGGRTRVAQDLLAAPSEWTIALLTDLNDRGQIVGVAIKGGESHAIRLDPSGLGLDLAEASAAVEAAAPTWVTAFAGPRPNPATSAGTRFAFTLGRPAMASVTLSDVAGRRVRTLVGDFEAGPNTLMWDGRDDGGARVGSGVLFAQFKGDGVHGTRKVILAR